MSTFVTVGNATQPFSRLLAAVVAARDVLPQPVMVQYGHNVFNEGGFSAVDFLGMEAFQRQIEQADLVILHAGAGSIITTLKAGKVPVVMPRRADLGEHVDDHQRELVDQLEATGRIVIAQDAQSLKASIGKAMTIQSTQKAGKQNEPALIGLLRKDLEEILE